MNRGNRAESLWEGNLPLRGSLRGSLREGFSELFRGFQRFSEIFQRFSEIFQRSSEVLSETLSEARFPSQRLSVLLPLIVLPLELSPTRFWNHLFYAAAVLELLRISFASPMVICLTFRSLEKYQCSTEGQKSHQHVAPVAVTISGNSLVFLGKIITSFGFLPVLAPRRVSTSSGKK